MTAVLDLLRRFRSLRVLVVGDAMLDTYLYGAATRLCPEGPVPIVARRSEEHHPGGAANCAANARALGAEVVFFGIAGADSAGAQLRATLRDYAVDDSVLLEDPHVATLHKQRIVADGHYVARWDTGDLRGASARRLLGGLSRELPRCDAVIVADYAYGTLSPPLIDRLSALCARHGSVLAVDSKALRRWARARATIVTPNAAEALALVDPANAAGGLGELRHAEAVARQLLEQIDAQNAAITLAERGALLVSRDGPATHVPGRSVPRAAVAGAGDTLACATALALAAGAPPVDAVGLGVTAATIAVTRPRTAVVGWRDLMQRSAALAQAVPAVAELRVRLAAEQHAGRTVVFTNGVWDLLHAGHVDFLRRARSLGDVLVVAANSDSSARRIKGAGRPIVGEQDRLAVVAALDSVDYALLYDDDTPAELIATLRPDIHTKGGDYSGMALPEAAAARSVGARIEILPLAGELSTTRLIDDIVLRMAASRSQLPGTPAVRP